MGKFEKFEKFEKLGKTWETWENRTTIKKLKSKHSNKRVVVKSWRYREKEKGRWGRSGV